MKTITISVINDLVTDQRLQRMAGTLSREGYSVCLTGRKLAESLPMEEGAFSFVRFKMFFIRGPFFYLFFNFRLFFYLLFKQKPDLLISIDLDTLPANYLISRIRKIPLVYDSHEYFTQVPELLQRPGVRRIWERLELAIVPHLKYAISVSDSISEAYMNSYGVDFVTIRNLSERREIIDNPDFSKLYPFQFKLIYQGALNLGRGIELMIRTMAYLENTVLFILGDGDISDDLKALSLEEGVSEKVIFFGKVHPTELHKITSQCDLGLSLEEDMGFSYRMSLPNKLFDYIQAGIPLICSDLPEMKKVVEAFQVGEIIAQRGPEKLAEQIQKMLKNEEMKKTWRDNLKKASAELCWEKEEVKLIKLVSRAIN